MLLKFARHFPSQISAGLAPSWQVLNRQRSIIAAHPLQAVVGAGLASFVFAVYLWGFAEPVADQPTVSSPPQVAATHVVHQEPVLPLEFLETAVRGNDAIVDVAPFLSEAVIEAPNFDPVYLLEQPSSELDGLELDTESLLSALKQQRARQVRMSLGEPRHQPAEQENEDCGCDKRLGTAVEWTYPPEAAAAQAEDEKKLLFVIHVSGNFALPKYT